jgi:alpha-beta hydrolase superfamily lysophospholipase
MRLSQRLVLKYIRTKFSILSSLSKKKAAEKAFQLFCTPQYRNKKKLPRIFEQAEKLRFEFKEYKIQGYRWNKESEKKLMILHGFESSVINFDRYVRPLIKKGYCVMAFDAPAHGRSTGRKINVLLYVEFINYINGKFGPVHNFIAHSLGGLALSLTVEKWKNNEDCKLVLIAPATETSSAADTFFKFLQLDEAVRKEFDKVIEKQGQHPPSWFSVNRAATNIKAQVLWCHDKNDDMTPLVDVAPLIKKGYPNFEFYITEGLGHRRIYRDNKVSRKIIDFL